MARLPWGVGILGSPGNTIGGSVAGAGNLISGNYWGILLEDPGTSGNLIEGNEIGTKAGGASALPNVYGISIGNTSGGNTIGGATSTPGTGAGNLIAGNSMDGIEIMDEVAADSIIGNEIGVSTLPGGGLSPANGADGISLQTVSAAKIGGPSSLDGNLHRRQRRSRDRYRRVP